MNILSLLTLGVVSFITMISFTKFLFKSLRKEESENGKISISYAVLMSGWLLGYALLNYNMIVVFSEFFESSEKINSNDLLVNCSEVGMLFIGTTILWNFICLQFVKVFSILFFGKRNYPLEMSANHVSFFFCQSVMLLALIVTTLPVFEVVLRMFLPTISVPFYR